MSVSGLVSSVQCVPRGSELVATAAVSATSLTVENGEDFDDAGGDLELNGVRYEYDSCDVETGVITLLSAVTTAGAVDDFVYAIAGGVQQIDAVAEVTLGDGDDAEVYIPYADRPLWPEGVYDDPVPVWLSDDLERIESVPGRVPVIDGTTFQTAATGERVVIRNDGGGGVIECFTGVSDETQPSYFNPYLTSGKPGLQLETGRTSDTPLLGGTAAILMASGSTSGAVFADVRVLARTITLGDSTSGLIRIVGAFTTSSALAIDGETWHTPSLAGAYTAASGQTPKYYMDGAGNVHLTGAVNRNAATSGDVVFTLPSGWRPTDTRYGIVRLNTIGNTGQVAVNSAGQVALSWAGTPTQIGVDFIFPTA